MKTEELLAAIDKIVAGIETDRFTIENLEALKARIIANDK